MHKLYRITSRKGSSNLSVRFYVPEHLKLAAGNRSEIWRSLGTASPKEAAMKAPSVVEKIINSLQPIKPSSHKEAIKAVREPTREELREAAVAAYHSLLDADEDERVHDAVAMQPGGPGKAAAHREYAQNVRLSIGRGDFSHGDVDYWSDVFGFEFQEQSLLRREFQQMLVRAEAEAAERAAERDLGLTLAVPADDLFRAPAPRPAPIASPISVREPAATPGLTAGELWTRYEGQKGDSLRPATLEDKSKTFNLFASHIGSERLVASISKAEAREFRDLLARRPLHAGTKASKRGLRLVDLVRLNELEGGKVVSRRTVAKQISVLSSIFDWLLREGYVDTNVWQHLAPEDTRHRSRRHPFTTAQLQQLIDSPVFTGCAGVRNMREMSKPGTYRATGPEYWLPLLGLFTGARLGELAQLEIGDIRKNEGIDYIAITNEGVDPKKSIKSHAGRRSVPVHSRLVELGFLDYVEAARRRSGSERLFPSLERNPKGQFANASRDFSKYISAIGIPIAAGEKKPTFHCLRHSFIDELRKKYGETDIQPLIGHEAKTVTRGYGVRETFDLEVRKKMVEAVEYQGISFSNLRATT